jgi:prevent-host-death family protein
MSAQPEITQRDLRNRSKEIMDAVESGRSFTVTRDGHEIGELIPLRRRRRFVSSQPTRKVGWAGGTRTSGRAGQAS